MGKRRDPAQRARDRRRTADLYLQGWLQAQIAGELDVNQSTVSRDLKALQKEWLQSALVDFDEAKSQELAKVDRLEREYWNEWVRSRLDKGSTLSETVVGDKGSKRQKAQVRKEGRLGDPRYLQGVQWCIERRCKILGIDAPIKTDMSGALSIRYIDDWRDNPSQATPRSAKDNRE